MHIEKLPFVTLNPNKEKLLDNAHPWIFSGAIKKINDLPDGTLVAIKTQKGDLRAFAYYFNSSLALRVITFDPKNVIDENFWRKRLKEAKNIRDALDLPNKKTNAFRLIHGESDGFSGLVCDIFSDSASIEIENVGLLNVIPLIKNFLIENYHIKNLFINQNNHKYWLLGGKKETLFLENDLSFIAKIDEGQKTGHFLDQRCNRELLLSYAKAKKVLDTFCYSGGFSVYALKADAKKVISVDISKEAIDLCKKNIALNNFKENHLTVTEDVFSYLRTLKKDEFDLIILDPPAFAKTKHHIEKAARGYKDINLLALKNIQSKGLIFTFSCSQHISVDLFKKIIFAASKDAKRKVNVIHELTQGPDHPVSVFCPETSYLKGLVLWVHTR